ncbi:MAG TPA: phosphoribosyltransferase family protein [Saprospiraceae bacterium]|nr:phosphoribosyltransferase family protein [Saprospiraceae bacterium]HMQ84504.1 phosphoribosyltransferase family protein [Saprospiraceae bacterium]
MKILDQRQIEQKIKRLAYEILERNYQESELVLAGINNNGMGFARLLLEAIQAVSAIPITLSQIRLNPADPLEREITIDVPIEQLTGKAIIVVDDVANTGRTIFYAIKPLLQTLPGKVEVAVLVDRSHKSFPIKVDYFGLSLATTLRENIEVKILEASEQAVFLS